MADHEPLLFPFGRQRIPSPPAKRGRSPQMEAVPEVVRQRRSPVRGRRHEVRDLRRWVAEEMTAECNWESEDEGEQQICPVIREITTLADFYPSRDVREEEIEEEEKQEGEAEEDKCQEGGEQESLEHEDKEQEGEEEAEGQVEVEVEVEAEEEEEEYVQVCTGWPNCLCDNCVDYAHDENESYHSYCGCMWCVHFEGPAGWYPLEQLLENDGLWASNLAKRRQEDLDTETTRFDLHKGASKNSRRGNVKVLRARDQVALHCGQKRVNVRKQSRISRRRNAAEDAAEAVSWEYGTRLVDVPHRRRAKRREKKGKRAGAQFEPETAQVQATPALRPTPASILPVQARWASPWVLRAGQKVKEWPPLAPQC